MLKQQITKDTLAELVKLMGTNAIIEQTGSKHFIDVVDSEGDPLFCVSMRYDTVGEVIQMMLKASRRFGREELREYN